MNSKIHTIYAYYTHTRPHLYSMDSVILYYMHTWLSQRYYSQIYYYYYYFLYLLYSSSFRLITMCALRRVKTSVDAWPPPADDGLFSCQYYKVFAADDNVVMSYLRRYIIIISVVQTRSHKKTCRNNVRVLRARTTRPNPSEMENERQIGTYVLICIPRCSTYIIIL